MYPPNSWCYKARMVAASYSPNPWHYERYEAGTVAASYPSNPNHQRSEAMRMVRPYPGSVRHKAEMVGACFPNPYYEWYGLEVEREVKP